MNWSHQGAIVEPKARVRNAADRDQVKRAEGTLRDEAEQLANAWRAVVGTVDGRRVLWDVLTQCMVHRTAYAMGDPYHTAFLSGRQDLGNFLIQQITKADPKAWLRMQAEQMRAEENHTEPEGHEDVV